MFLHAEYVLFCDKYLLGTQLAWNQRRFAARVERRVGSFIAIHLLALSSYVIDTYAFETDHRGYLELKS